MVKVDATQKWKFGYLSMYVGHCVHRVVSKKTDQIP